MRSSCRRSQLEEVRAERDAALAGVRREQAAAKAARDAANNAKQTVEDRAAALAREDALLSSNKQRFEVEVRGPFSGTTLFDR